MTTTKSEGSALDGFKLEYEDIANNKKKSAVRIAKTQTNRNWRKIFKPFTKFFSVWAEVILA